MNVLIQIQTKSETVAATWQLMEAQKAGLASQQNKVAQQSTQLDQQTRQVFKHSQFITMANLHVHSIAKSSRAAAGAAVALLLDTTCICVPYVNEHQLACSGMGFSCIFLLIQALFQA